MTLIGQDKSQVAEARRELVRIGVDRLNGAATGDIHSLGARAQLRSYRVADFADLPNVLGDADVAVLDVRQRNEYASSHIAGAVNIPLHELAGRLGEVRGGQVWVHCESGYRSSIAASMIDRAGRTVVLIDDDFANAEKLHLTG